MESQRTATKRPRLHVLAPVSCCLAGALMLTACESQKGRKAASRPSPQETAKSGARPQHGPKGPHVPAPLHDPREKHLRNIRQLTFGGENAEAYWSFKGDKLVLQARGGSTGFSCDQIFIYDLKSGKRRLISTGKGRTTCSYFTRDDKRIIYASTHKHSASCPPDPDRSQGYVWPIYASYDIFSVSIDNPKDILQLTSTPGYDAEATVDPKTGRVIFTSVRDGDLELYSMKDDGSDVQRLTKRIGYDGGAFYSQDGSQIVWRATKFGSDKERGDYKRLLRRALVRPSKMEIWVSRADGSEKVRVTNNGKANFAPYFCPDGKQLLFASNIANPRTFHIYKINTDGTGQERITYSSRFNSFPMFSHDGKYLAFASNRSNKKAGETNIFVAEWVD